MGVPEKFVGNYRAARVFLARLEGLCQNRRALGALRASPAWASFQGRWKLSVYFGLRFQVHALLLYTPCLHPSHQVFASTSCMTAQKPSSAQASAKPTKPACA